MSNLESILLQEIYIDIYIYIYAVCCVSVAVCCTACVHRSGVELQMELFSCSVVQLASLRRITWNSETWHCAHAFCAMVCGGECV